MVYLSQAPSNSVRDFQSPMIEADAGLHPP